MTERRPRRRGSVALASRVAIGGVSLSVTLGMVAVLAVSEPPEDAVDQEPVVVAGPVSTEAPAPAAPGTTIVVRRVHVLEGPPTGGTTSGAASRSSSSGAGASTPARSAVAAATPAPAAAPAPARPAPAPAPAPAPVATSRAS